MNEGIMKALGFETEVLATKFEVCPICRAEIKEDNFRDKLSLKEYYISGLCQQCQDKVFGK